jgi:hypothetical protein
VNGVPGALQSREAASAAAEVESLRLHHSRKLFCLPDKRAFLLFSLFTNGILSLTNRDLKGESEMKAALLTAYDKEGRDVEIRDLPVPQIGANDVLVKIRTTSRIWMRS